jgi:hypothetical protein
MQPSFVRDRPAFGSAQPGDEERSLGQIIDGRPEQSLNPELGARIKAEPTHSQASLRTLCCVLASAVCYYVATQVAWALRFPDSKVSLFSPARGSSFYSSARPHSALVGLRTRRRERPFSRYPTGALAALYALTASFSML